jgi:hypothetical protein
MKFEVAWKEEKKSVEKVLKTEEDIATEVFKLVRQDF